MRVPTEVVNEIKKMDLLTYLQNYEPEELVRVGNGTYTTKTHDSLRISNGLWHWFSRGIGGKNAVDYLMEDRNLSFIEAVELIANNSKNYRPFIYENEEKFKEKEFILPQKSDNFENIKSYLIKRGIDKEIIQECINNQLIYEEKGNRNVVFVGYDKNKNARYAFCRGTNETRYMREAKGSDKSYSFRLESVTKSSRLHLFESAIDLLSYATLMKQKNLNYHNENMISLGGVSNQNAEENNLKIPKAIEKFLEENPQIEQIHLHLDNDEIGRKASKYLVEILSKKYEVFDSPPPKMKDCNDYLCYALRNKNFIKSTKENSIKKEKIR